MIGEELSSSAQSARTAATPLGYVDHSPFGGVDAHLVYARRDDGSDVHISEVESRTGAVWACPACDHPVVARKGEILAHHFSHKGRGSGCGLGAETNAHLWAKRILARELRIRIPAVNAQVGDRSDPIHGSQIYEFDEVYVERHDGNLVPDIVLVSKGRKMWVEIHVTHPCGPKKIAEIRERGISVVEVDLSDFRTSKDEAAIAHALLHTASRKWLFNRKQEAGEARLRAQIAAEEAAKAAQAQRNARSVIDAIGRIRIGAPVATVRDDHERIVALGLEEWIGRPSRGKSGFVVAPSHWQAALLARVVLPLAEGHDPYDTFDDFEALRGVAACLAPAFRKPIDRDVLRAAYGLGGGILCPLEAIRDYFDALVSTHVLEFETAETWRLSKEARTYLRRRLYRERIITGRLSSLRQRSP